MPGTVISSALVLLVLVAGCGDAPETGGGAADAGTRKAAGGFIDRAAENGIDFKMAFLPAEQGEHFKVNLYDHGTGVVVGDIDGDGDDDVYFLNQLGANALYRNDGEARFTNVTAEAGPVALADRICVAGACDDIDNDGDQDLFVTSTRGGNALLVNDGTGKFTDGTKAAGLEHVGHCQGVSIFDADGDGDLDILVACTAQWTIDTFDAESRYYPGAGDLFQLIDSDVEFNIFYRNNGDGTFTDGTDASGLRGVGWGSDIAVFDYDEHGDLDVYVGNMFGSSQLYANDGKGVFKDVTRDVLDRTPWGTTGVNVLDYDGDGKLDLLAVDQFG
jgi:hypothetical protein